mgnify:CR=1 FL=1
MASFGENSDTSEIEVVYDPRVDVSIEDLQKRSTFLKEVEEQTSIQNDSAESSDGGLIRDNLEEGAYDALYIKRLLDLYKEKGIPLSVAEA